MITAQTIELANERNDIDILRRRLDASVLLIKALGGGWNASNLPTFGASTVRDSAPTDVGRFCDRIDLPTKYTGLTVESLPASARYEYG